MSDLLNEICAVYDSREKSLTRIEIFKNFIESNGGAVEKGALSLCDYKIEGIFREKEISLGIEFKTLNDFSSSYQDLPDKLARSFELYNDVGLFVEVPQFKVSSSDEFHATVVNPAITDGSADVLNYAALMNSLESWQSEGIHVRQIGGEYLFGYAIGSVLINITKTTHRGLEISKIKDYKTQYLNCISKLDGVGYKTALKIAKYFPNMHWLASVSEEDLQDKLGKITGHKLSQFLRNHELESNEWRNGYPSEQKDKVNLEGKVGTTNDTVKDKVNVPKTTENPLNPLKLSSQANELTLQSPVSSSKSGVSHTDTSSLGIQESSTTQDKFEYKETTRDEKPDNSLIPANDKFTEKVRFRDVSDFVRSKPRSTQEVGDYFGFSPEYCLKVLYELKEKKKIWFDKSTLKWDFGGDMNPLPVQVDVEMDVGV